MQLTELIIFNVLFWGFVLFYCISIVKEEDAIQKQEEKISERQRLEIENTEYDYGHDVDYKKNENVW